MSDYMFMLENHLVGEQSKFLSELLQVCDASGTNVFLAGGAMRDMLGGFPIRDLDFVVEGNALKLARDLAKKLGARITSLDELRRTAELILSDGSTVQLAMARHERYPKPGGKPQVRPASIHEDLRCRDFTINSIALSLGRASRGLLLDPTNGLADLERRELRAVHNYVFYDDPVRLWRLLRLKVRLGFTVEERTAAQHENAHQGQMQNLIPPRVLFEQLRHTAHEPNPGEVLKALEQAGLLAQVSPALTGPKLNLHGFARLQKARQLIPFGVTLRVDDFALFFHLLTQKLTPNERATLMKNIAAQRREVDVLSRLEARARKLEKALKSAKLQKPSQVHEVLVGGAGETVLFLYLETTQRLVQDRIRHYLQKYMLAASEVTDREVEAEGLTPGTPKFARRKAEKIVARLDGRARKPAPAPEVVPSPAPVMATPRRTF
ncbi:MAG: CCA tRNA nucleotidyltransferase [Acidobacteria bacterium]|nr:CCA tRNA nucleotidyltransferase [Acidobacteriota bacterium]